MTTEQELEDWWETSDVKKAFFDEYGTTKVPWTIRAAFKAGAQAIIDRATAGSASSNKGEGV